MKSTILGISGFVFLLIILAPICALDDVRSGIYNIGQKKVVIDGTAFPGFYYDIDDNIVTEKLILSLSDIDPDGASAVLSDKPDTKGNRGVVYSTTAKLCEFDFEPWGHYREIWFLGEGYFAAYDGNVTSETDPMIPMLYDKCSDRNLMVDEQICKILIDDDDEMTLTPDAPLELDEGYVLSIKNIDENGKRVYLDLSKEGEVVDSKVVQLLGEGGNINDETYYYKTDVGDTKEIVTIAVHFESVFGGSDQELATVDGIWQISDTPVQIKTDTKYDKMSIREVNATSLTVRMDNKDNKIDLIGDEDILLMANIYIYTADQDVSADNPLRYFIYKDY